MRATSATTAERAGKYSARQGLPRTHGFVGGDADTRVKFSGAVLGVETASDGIFSQTAPGNFPDFGLIGRSQKRASEKFFRKSLAAGILSDSLLRPAHCRGFAKKPRSRGFFVA